MTQLLPSLRLETVTGRRLQRGPRRASSVAVNQMDRPEERVRELHPSLVEVTAEMAKMGRADMHRESGTAAGRGTANVYSLRLSSKAGLSAFHGSR